MVRRHQKWRPAFVVVAIFQYSFADLHPGYSTETVVHAGTRWTFQRLGSVDSRWYSMKFLDASSHLYKYKTLLSDSRSRVRTTLLWVFLQFCQFHMCTIQEQSRGKSFLERFLKKIDFSPTGKVVVMQILVSCIDSFFDSILLFYAKFPFIW